MSFTVTNLKLHPTPLNCFYIFDTNILLYLLGLPSNEPFVTEYLTFFMSVYGLSEIDPSCKIILPQVQISETFNRLLRYESDTRYHNSVYNGRKGWSPSKFYKEIFRPSTDFEITFNKYKSEWEIYESIFVLRNSSIHQTIGESLTFDLKKLDLNDNYILLTAKEYNALIVTHDADFYNQGVSIVTMLPKMINQHQSSLIKLNVKNS
ncbi:type II toxin-antitoxin system VapC family toxin [Mucilaginibacter sp. 14171R-50]|uniref:type II toxin-antitoxin system VapC family toxin n=1 Tax=Mucilaginibacter sp. 14171R-50 TaxID=2703789 RepID=UPI00138DCA92|nr:type II toxin-antitoxin system VapC family toxin [Mucilaginibacter sp. 14171R-50]QHS57754.1 type II toxin-antitoxin system VapC family toxin [Mucilaginibacter sp. 14171R-50]